ncbi:GntR family transcriptional regulator [Victivallis sp. Marseille-Q1083]|uniref:GntR family transcriptional regulator n=1 Tax=Victivallis sp. Marseille-Q1083 TaxID=2717288 RepID=UPI0015893FBD|nr:GntR family transcriptional regulator [Victivallis sp. Marseille-Q1083]
MGFKYQDLAQYYREKIFSGEIAAGTRMCTEAELVERHRISRKTARQALEELKKSGLVRSRRGAGTFVRPGAGGEKRQARNCCRNITLLFIDMVNAPDSYEQYLASALSQLANAAELSLSVRYLTTGDFFNERTMENLRQSGTDILWVDGFVNTVHEYLLKRLEIPYLLIGDRPEQPCGPQVKFDWQALSFEAAEYLCRNSSWPVVAICKPLQAGGNPYYFYHGIQLACRRHDRPLELHMSLHANDFDAVPLLGDHFRMYGRRKCSIITSPHFVPSIEKAFLIYSEYRFDGPIAVAGARHLIPAATYPNIRYFNFDIGEYASRIFEAHVKFVDSLGGENKRSMER